MENEHERRKEQFKGRRTLLENLSKKKEQVRNVYNGGSVRRLTFVAITKKKTDGKRRKESQKRISVDDQTYKEGDDRIRKTKVWKTFFFGMCGRATFGQISIPSHYLKTQTQS